MEILQLSQNSARIDLKLDWLTPTQLRISYKGPASVDFQAIRCDGIDISVQETSARPGSAQ
jgi:hypothetical protein